MLHLLFLLSAQPQATPVRRGVLFASSVTDNTTSPVADCAFYSSVTDNTTSLSMRLAFTQVVDGQTTTQYITETGIGFAFKPNPSLDGSKLTFFLSPTKEYDQPNQIAVIGQDGSNLRVLTSLPQNIAPVDWNANWLRDGSDRIIFFRMAPAPFIPTPSLGVTSWITSIDSNPGEEVLLTTNFAWEMSQEGRVGREHVYDSFDDGSIMMMKMSYDILNEPYNTITQPCRLTFDGTRTRTRTYCSCEAGSYCSCNMDPYVPDGARFYTTSCTNFTLEGIEWNTNVAYAFVSSSQKYLTYLKGLGSPYSVSEPLKGQVCFADLDLKNNVIRNEKCIFQANGGVFQANGGEVIWYAKTTQDETQILYTKADGGWEGQGRVYAYDIATGSTASVSSDDDVYYHRYASPLNYNVPMNP